VLVLGSESAPVRPAFLELLRIQVVKSALVEAGPPLQTTSLPDRLAEAAGLVEQQDAILAVWVEEAAAQDPSVSDFVVYAVGKERHRALIEIARLRAGEGPDIDRALALKVGAFLDMLLAERAPEVDVARSFARGDLAPPMARLSIRFMGEVGAVTALGITPDSVQGGLSVALGGRLGGRSWLGEAYGALLVLTDIDVTGSAGRLSVSEQVLAGGVRALHLRRRFALGGFFQAGARLLDAKGTSPPGGRGTLSRTVALLLWGAEARFELASRIALRGAAGLELDLTRQSFSIDGARASDLGRLRPLAMLSFVLAAP